MYFGSSLIRVLVEACTGRVAAKAVRAEASVWGLVLGPVTTAFMPEFNADSKSYETCKHASIRHDRHQTDSIDRHNSKSYLPAGVQTVWHVALRMLLAVRASGQGGWGGGMMYHVVYAKKQAKLSCPEQ